MLYQLGGGSLERRAAKAEIIIAEFHHIDAPTPSYVFTDYSKTGLHGGRVDEVQLRTSY